MRGVWSVLTILMLYDILRGKKYTELCMMLCIKQGLNQSIKSYGEVYIEVVFHFYHIFYRGYVTLCPGRYCLGKLLHYNFILALLEHVPNSC